MGKAIDKRMKELGGHRFLDLHCADEATGLEEVVEDFNIKVVSSVLKLLAEDTDASINPLPLFPELEDMKASAQNSTSETGSTSCSQFQKGQRHCLIFVIFWIWRSTQSKLCLSSRCC